MTIAEAAKRLGKSEQSIRRAIKSGKLIAVLKQRIAELEDTLKEKDRAVEEAHKAAAEASQRHDMIVMQLTRQLEQSQRLLEYHQASWWRRWFRKAGR